MIQSIVVKLINWQQKIYTARDIWDIGTRKMAKPVTVKKRANGNEVVCSSNFRVFGLLFPIFTVGATFLARAFVDWELTLHACVTFNFRHNRFYPALRPVVVFLPLTTLGLAVRTTHL